MTTKETNKAKKAVNKALYQMGCKPQQGIPVCEIVDLLNANGFSDASNLEGIYCGREGRVHEAVGSGAYIVLSWHKYENVNSYEIVSYVS